MKTKEQVTQYVKDFFERYELDQYGFFFETDEETNERVDIPLFALDTMDDDTLARISSHTGLSKEEILSCDDKAATRFWDRYPFIGLFMAYKAKAEWYSQYKSKFPTLEDMLTNALSDGKIAYPAESRYDYHDLKARMIRKLKEIDAFMPGTYHHGANIEHLRMRTEVFFSFPQCKEMLSSFISMVNSLRDLFFKALRNELTDAEINELNFLANRLDATDAVMPSVVITYDNICRYKKAYLEENLTDFFSYVKIRSFAPSAPWRCQEFFDDLSLVQEFVKIFPQAKAQMRQFAMDVTKFECVFVWSDAAPFEAPEYDGDDSSIDALLERLQFPVEMRTREMSRVYVEKNVDEMFGWEQYAYRLSDASSSEAKGGLALPVRELDLSDRVNNIKRMQLRVNAKLGR